MNSNVSLNSLQLMVRNCVLAQLTPFVQQFRSLKNQIDAHQSTPSNSAELYVLRSQIQQIRQQSAALKLNMAALQEKYSQNINYSLMKCQRRIEHLSDDVKNIQIKMASLHLPNLPDKEPERKHSQIQSFRLQQVARLDQQVVRLDQNQVNHMQYFSQLQVEDLMQRQKQVSGFRKSQKIFRYHLGNPHNDRFEIDSQLNKIKVTYAKEWDGHCYNFIKNGDIPYNQIAKFNLRQAKTVSRYIMSGVGTEKTLGMKDAHKSKDCIAYFSANGYIWSSGACSVGGRSISDGEIITVGVDRNRNTISWSASNKILATSQLPPTFSNQQLFWLVLLVHENDSVEILLD